jgi:hypothetical protein
MRGELDVLYLYYYINNYTDHMFQKKNQSQFVGLYMHMFFFATMYTHMFDAHIRLACGHDIF